MLIWWSSWWWRRWCWHIIIKVYLYSRDAVEIQGCFASHATHIKWASKTNVYVTKARWVPIYIYIYKHMCINRFRLLCDRFSHRFFLGFWLVFEVCCVVVLQEINQFLHKQALASASLYTNKHLYTHVYINKPVYGLFFPPINLCTNALLQLQTSKATHNFTQQLFTYDHIGHLHPSVYTWRPFPLLSCSGSNTALRPCESWQIAGG